VRFAEVLAPNLGAAILSLQYRDTRLQFNVLPEAEKNGFCLWYKSMEKQRFQWPKHDGADTVSINGEELNWFLYGFDLSRSDLHRTLHYSLGEGEELDGARLCPQR
jgi:hypothetical protein